MMTPEELEPVKGEHYVARRLPPEYWWLYRKQPIHPTHGKHGTVEAPVFTLLDHEVTEEERKIPDDPHGMVIWTPIHKYANRQKADKARRRYEDAAPGLPYIPF